MTNVKKQILWISSALLGVALLAISICCTIAYTAGYFIVLVLSTVLFLTFLTALLVTKRMRIATSGLCIYFFLTGTTIVFLGRPPDWEICQALRSSWGQKVKDSYLQENLSLGDSPDDVLRKMGINPSFLNRRTDLVYGMDFATVLEAYGASTELLKPSETEEGLTFFVWSRPLCGGGCCDGAVVLTFHEKKLKRIEVYDPSITPGPEHDVARYDEGGVWTSLSGEKKHFSASKTILQILSTNLPPQVILGEAKQQQTTGANKSFEPDGLR